MWRLLQYLILGHAHNYKIIAQNPTKRTKEGIVIALGIQYTTRCDKCGKIKFVSDLDNF